MEATAQQSAPAPAEDAERHWHRPPEITQTICRRAYEIYRQRVQCGAPGNAESDWFEAEADVFAHAEHVDPDPAAPDWN